MNNNGIIEFSDFLENIYKEQVKINNDFKNKYNLKHPGTIGDMYEGLTDKILKESLFKELNLKVVTGQILNHTGNLSNQIDCMIVTKIKEKIPNSEAYICDINDVVAIFEIKKNLYGKDLEDGYLKMQNIYENFEIDNKKNPKLKIELLYRGYELITGKRLEDILDYVGENVDLANFDSVLINTLIWENILPLRIIFGYDGYANEKKLKDAVLGLLTKENIKSGPLVNPNLIISKNSSVIKLNGNPYATRLIGYKPAYFNEHWPIYGSYDKNPILVLLEVLWTKLRNMFPDKIKTTVFGDYLKYEEIHPFLVLEHGKYEGKYRFIARDLNYFPERNEKELIKVGWEPLKVSENLFIIFNELCNNGQIDLNSLLIENILENEKISLQELKNQLLDTGYIMFQKSKILLRTEECACIVSPEGYLVGENKDDKMTKWLIENTLKKEKN